MAFVGNLPPDASAEEMKQLCSQVGEVILFRIVYDRETGKPKGYGFCEYRDSKLVDSAVELLHGFEHRGTSLYVRRANQEKQSNNNQSQSSHAQNGNNKKMAQQKKKKKSSSSKRKSVDEITRVVSSFSTSEKREILSQMKVLIEQNEKGAKEILLENPQLAQALLFIQMEFNLVKVQDIHALTQNVSNTQIVNNKNNANNTNTNTLHDIDNDNDNNHGINEQAEEEDNDIQMATNNTNNDNNDANKVDEKRLKGLSNQQQNVLGHVLKMNPEEIAKLPADVQKKIRAVQAQLAKRNMPSK